MKTKGKIVFSELAEKINQEMESGDFSLQAVFNRNIEAIEQLKSEGYSYKTIFKKLDTGLHENHFRDLIRRAKKQKITCKLTINKNVNIRKPVSDNHHNPIISNDSWKNVGITSDYTIQLIETKSDLTPEIIKSWNCANESQISKRVTEYIMKANRKR